MHRKCCIVWRYQLVFPFNVLVFCKLSLIYSAILKNMVEKLIFFFIVLTQHVALKFIQDKVRQELNNCLSVFCKMGPGETSCQLGINLADKTAFCLTSQRCVKV